MNAMRRPAGIEIGAWARFDGQVRAVTTVTTTTVPPLGELGLPWRSFAG
ncbi:hypothetical protein [Streptomyces sp. NPDC059604]